ncbi:MAG TPA: NirA family protein [Verrucomicrobiae bacterium]
MPASSTRDVMSAPASFDSIQGEKLTHEQTAYLDGFFAGLRERGLAFANVAPNPVKQPAELSADLIFEERVKRELHPLDAYPLLLEHAAANKAPDKENIYRFKWQGLFYLAPHKEAFMCRLKIPGGLLKTFQLREVAKISQELTSGYVQITTRANLQLRLIEPKNAPELLRRIQSVGLSSKGAGADNIRNITANPTAGIDPHELIDTLPLCQELAQIIVNDRALHDLPRKFNIAFDGGGLIGTVEDTNDIGLKAVKFEQPQKHGDAEIPAGIYFRVKVGGATGHQAFARDLGVLVKPEEAVKVALAATRVYVANGNRGDRKKARLKHLLEKWTLEQYLDEIEKTLGYKLLRGPEQKLEASNSKFEIPHSHVGVFAQKQKGLNYLGVAVPVGNITPKQMIRLAEIADLYGSGEVRLTVWQNLIVPNIPDAYVETVKKAVVKAGFDWRQSNLRSGLVACTGNSYCKFAASNTKAHALELADYLEKKIELDQPINIHLTGCPNSCAQHYMGDVGLLGTKVKVSGETLEGYHVFVGGGFGGNQAVGRQVFTGVSVEQLKPTLKKMLAGYLRQRTAGETFQQFTARHDLNALQTIFSEA